MVPSITMLIMYLPTGEQRFERSLALEHVEDIRMDKRLNWLSPKKDMFMIGHVNVLALYRTWNMMMRPHLEMWQNRMRACFDYRILRDWGYGRQWKKDIWSCLMSSRLHEPRLKRSRIGHLTTEIG